MREASGERKEGKGRGRRESDREGRKKGRARSEEGVARREGEGRAK